MERAAKPFVHHTIDAVDAVIFDPDGHLDPDHFDHYATFGAARDAALSSIELMLDEGDYDDEAHKSELLWMLKRLEPASSFADLQRHRDYKAFLKRLAPAVAV